MENNEIIKPSKRLALTIISTLILILVLIFFFMIIGFDKNQLKENVPNDNAAAGIAGAVGAAFALIFMVMIAIGVLVASFVGLLLSFLQRKNPYKAIKIYSYVIDALYAIVIICTVIRFITWLV